MLFASLMSKLSIRGPLHSIIEMRFFCKRFKIDAKLNCLEEINKNFSFFDS